MTVNQRAEAILRRIPPNSTSNDGETPLIVEVGVFHGELSELLLRAGHRVWMVDNWLPYLKQPSRYVETGDYHSRLEIETQTRAEIGASRRAAPFGPRANIFKMDSVAAARSMMDKSADMVFLDADHSYEGVKEDIHEWMPKVKPGGWLGGHDYGEPPPGLNVGMKFGVTVAVEEMIAPWYVIETDLNMTWFVKL